MSRYACTPDPDDGPAFDHDWQCGNCGSYDWHRVIDLNHPSNLGHLCALADKVCGQEIELVQDGDGGWLAVGKRGARQGATRGQALAAAIVAAMGEKPEERG